MQKKLKKKEQKENKKLCVCVYVCVCVGGWGTIPVGLIGSAAGSFVGEIAKTLLKTIFSRRIRRRR